VLSGDVGRPQEHAEADFHRTLAARDLVRPDTQVFDNRARGQTGRFTRFREGPVDKTLPLRHSRTENGELEQ
jgi:hypothetical protein